MLQKAYFGGGCFWCVEAGFDLVRGVTAVTSGYAGGKMDNPDYDSVSAGHTGHAEVVEVVYDPAQIAYSDLLTVFFTLHDPTTLNRQGNDSGTQYRSAIYFIDPADEIIAKDFIAQLAIDQVFEKPIVTEIKPLEKFYPAEKYHQKYYENNSEAGYCQVVIAPKLVKLRQMAAQFLK